MSKSKPKKVVTFAVGDRVSWKSQAGGYTKKKTGTVVEVVPAFKFPKDKGFGSSRKAESYIVEVVYELPKPSRHHRVRAKKPERYWPLVTNLQLVKRGSASIANAAAVRPHPTGVTDPEPATTDSDPYLDGILAHGDESSDDTSPGVN